MSIDLIQKYINKKITQKWQNSTFVSNAVKYKKKCLQMSTTKTQTCKNKNTMSNLTKNVKYLKLKKLNDRMLKIYPPKKYNKISTTLRYFSKKEHQNIFLKIILKFKKWYVIKWPQDGKKIS